MLTIEMLRQSSALTGLTDAQFMAIAEMSKNDENSVIGTRIGALHGQYDTDIFDVTGVKKKDGEKSYDYAKRVLSEYKQKAESAKNVEVKLDEAKAEVVKLQAKLEEGAGDDTLRQQLKDAKAQVTQLQTKLQAEKDNFKTKESEFAAQLKGVHVDYAFNAATAGIKFKAGITEPIQRTLLSAAKAEVLSKGTPDFIEDGGVKKLILRGADGNILNNPKNNLNPYTIEELVMETSLKDVIETGRKQNGSGTGQFGGGAGGNGNMLDLTGVRTQVEADKAIEAHLLANGLTRDSVEFGEKLTEIRTENNVSNLPLR